MEKSDIISEIKKSQIVDGIRSVSLIGKGGFSDCYLLDTDEGKLVLKIRRDMKIERLAREYRLLSQKVLLKYNLAPKVYKFDKTCKSFRFPYLLEECVIGKHPEKVDIEFIKSMAKWYKQLHIIKNKKLEIVEVNRINSISFWVNETFEKSKKIKFPNNDIRINYLRYFEGVINIAKQNDSILKRNTYNFIQCDPSKENIFIMKDKTIKLIDWDFAGYHIFERDLVLFIDCNNLDSNQEKIFLKEYGIKVNNNFMKKLNILRLVMYGRDLNWLLTQDKINLIKIQNLLKKGFQIIMELRY